MLEIQRVIDLTRQLQRTQRIPEPQPHPMSSQDNTGGRRSTTAQKESELAGE